MVRNYKAVLGVHVGHDRCACLIIDGTIVAAIAEERLDRVKYSPGDILPTQSINAVIDIANIRISDVSAIGISFSGILLSEELKATWKDEVSSYFKISQDNVFIVGHHLAHAYAVYYTSPFDEAAIMIADGAGDLLSETKCEAESYYFANNGNIELFFSRYQSLPVKLGSPLCEYRWDYMLESEYELPVSVGRKYEQITKLIGFSFGQAGKTMGLSPYGKRTIDCLPDELGMNHSLTRGDYLDALHEKQRASGIPYQQFIKDNKANIAKDIQFLTEELLLSCVQEFSKLSMSKNLCLSGGVFLNCVANKKIVDKQYFNNVFITPASGDDGQAIGAAFYVNKKIFGGKKENLRHSPYLGPKYSLQECAKAVSKFQFEFQKIDDDEARANHIVEALIKDKVFGILQGRSELGPRALGNRSIIASPMNSEMRDHINHNIKYREDFRPFAPMVTVDDVDTFFETDVESPYMLLTCNVKPEYRNKLPAITHKGGSARVQTVRKEDNPFIYRLLKTFGNKTGFPILLNTSFNTANEPIVETPEDALRTLIKTELNGVVLENIVVEI